MSTEPYLQQPAESGASPLRIGTRGSALAMAQAHLVAGMLADRQIPSVLVVVRTQGDADQTTSLAVLGGQGVFTSALQDALLRNEIDIAVHSAKDLPTIEHPDLSLVAFLARQDPRDVIISKSGAGLESLPSGARVGTSSRRRIAQLLAVRPDLAIVDLRGNIDTRIRRATEGDLDAVIIAAAGMHRLGWHDRITSYLPLDRFVPAPGQAALALEIRRDDAGPANRAAELDDPAVSGCVRAERAFLRAIGAGCTTPVGAHATHVADHFQLRAMVASPNLLDAQWATYGVSAEDAEDGAGRIAREMLGLVRQDRRSRSQPRLGDPARPAVLVTRPGDSGLSLGAALEGVGATVVIEPMLLVTPTRSPEASDAVNLMGSGGFEWIALTSAMAIDGIVANADALVDIAEMVGDAQVAVVGEATAARLRSLGIEPSLIAGRSDASGLAAELVARGVRGKAIWLPQSNLARDDLATELRAAGANVTATSVYRVEQPNHVSSSLRAALLQGDIDAAVFASPSAVRHLVNLLGPDRSTLDDVRLVAIGPTTAAELGRLGLDVAGIAERPSDDGIIDAVRRALDADAESEQTIDHGPPSAARPRRHPDQSGPQP